MTEQRRIIDKERAVSHSPDQGLEFWIAAREAWTLGHLPYDDSPEYESKATRALRRKMPAHSLSDKAENNEVNLPTHFYELYEQLISGEPLPRPLPLSAAILLLNHGWREDGLFTPAPPDVAIPPNASLPPSPSPQEVPE